MNQKRLSMAGAVIALALVLGVGVASATKANKTPKPLPSLVGKHIAPPDLTKLPQAAQDALAKRDGADPAAVAEAQTGVTVPTDFFAMGKNLGLSDEEARAFAERSERARGRVTDKVDGK
jgi:hypothetical protein